MTLDNLNSVFNLGANLILMIGGLYFYYYHLRKQIGVFYYHLLRLASAMLLSGAFMRVLVDIDYLIAGESAAFIWYEAVIALSRNYGLGIILLYTLIKYRQLKNKLL
jgi:hypothetical protein